MELQIHLKIKVFYPLVEIFLEEMVPDFFEINVQQLYHDVLAIRYDNITDMFQFP